MHTIKIMFWKLFFLLLEHKRYDSHYFIIYHKSRQLMLNNYK